MTTQKSAVLRYYNSHVGRGAVELQDGTHEIKQINATLAVTVGLSGSEHDVKLTVTIDDSGNAIALALG